MSSRWEADVCDAVDVVVAHGQAMAAGEVEIRADEHLVVVVRAW